MKNHVNVIGVGMVKFAKPGASEEYNVMASKAAKTALADAKVDYKDIEQAYAARLRGAATVRRDRSQPRLERAFRAAAART